MSEHPEKRPELPPLNRFTFSLDAGKHAEKDLELRLSAMEARINKIVRRIEIQNVPVLQHILGLTHDEEELERLGKALLRVAPLVSEMDEIQKRKSLVDLAVKEPQWLAATFADFSEDVEEITTEFED